MTIDGKLLAKARNTLDKKCKEREAVIDRRTEEVYTKAPKVREIDMELGETMAELIAVSISPDITEKAGKKINDISTKNLSLQEERKKALVSAGYKPNYLDEEYFCKDCNDTGYIGTVICDCLLELYKKEQRLSLSSLLKLGDETFESFILSYYDDKPTTETAVSPRKSMEIVYETCVEYARKFGPKSMNLFFNGAPGLGKTYLSACIARVVAEKGFSVVYDMAGSIFSKFEDAKFNKSDNPEETRDEIKRYLECDLLILDDLGTEMITEFTKSVLYEVVNTRLISAKKTIVSSNMTIDEMRQRYTEQIMSRLEGEYHVLTFYGDDIRKKKKEES